MLTKNQAIQAVRKTLPTDFDVLEKEVIEKEYGWAIFSQSKRYIETKDPFEMCFGSGGTLVEKSTGRLIEFGSAFALETNLKIYELGYVDHPDVDLAINAISNPKKTVDLLDRLEITYVKPEVEGGTTWRIPIRYSVGQLRERIRHLPCRFHLGSLYYRWEVLEEMKSSACVQFELTPNEGFRDEV